MPPELTDDHRDLLQEIARKFDAADEVHAKFRDRWDELDALYHNRNDWKRQVAGAANDRDVRSLFGDAMHTFGAELFIPYSFTVVETVLPRMLSNRPRMLVLPRSKASERNVENVKFIIDAQQDKCRYELKLQTTGKSGLIYGLGAQKVAWRREERDRQTMQRKLVRQGLRMVEDWVPDSAPYCVWDDPDANDVSIYDLLWDPYADSMETAGFIFHRTWRSTSYCIRMVESGQWAYLPDLTAADVDSINAKEKYTGVHKGRKRFQNDTASYKEPIHEVWEFHDGKQVITVLDRTYVVKVAANPHPMGRMPFHIYRPTEVVHQFCGKGEIEPIRDLQYEMNAIRTDRRWNALLKLHVAHFYEDGTLDPADVKLEPGALIPVNGNPRDLLMPVTVGDIPNSGYMEENALKQDINLTTGVSEQVSGTGDAGQTATGVQLIQAAAGIRIQNKTRRLEVELIKPAAEDFLALNQQRIREEREVREPVPPVPGDPERRWAWRVIGPADLAGEFDVIPDGGSTAPENVPQMRQDAQLLAQMLTMSQGALDASKVFPEILRKMGYDQPETLLATDNRVPPATLDYIKGILTDELDMEDDVAHEIIGTALNAALEAEQAQRQGGPPQAAQEPSAGMPEAA